MQAYFSSTSEAVSAHQTPSPPNISSHMTAQPDASYKQLSIAEALSTASLRDRVTSAVAGSSQLPINAPTMVDRTLHDSPIDEAMKEIMDSFQSCFKLVDILASLTDAFQSRLLQLHKLVCLRLTV